MSLGDLPHSGVQISCAVVDSTVAIFVLLLPLQWLIVELRDWDKPVLKPNMFEVPHIHNIQTEHMSSQKCEQTTILAKHYGDCSVLPLARH